MPYAELKEEWKKPFTSKRYVHPPFSENMFTMWPDMMLICGDVVEATRGYRSAGLRLLYGDEPEAPLYSEVKYETREDGAPVHRIHQMCGECAVTMESFCTIERKPVCYTEFLFENPSEQEISVKMALLPRTGQEEYLTGSEVDGYAHYNTNVHNWGYIPTQWTYQKDKMTDGEYEILLKNEDSFVLQWQGDEKGLPWYQRRLLTFEVSLKPFACKRLQLAFRHGEAASFDYDREKENVLAYWKEKQGRIRIYPGGEKYHKLVSNLVMQCLQMFSYPVGKDYVLPRQGGMQRVIWPVEAVEFLMALDRIGDFSDFTQQAYETFFFTLQAKDGEDCGAVQNLSGQKWGSITGGSCMGCAVHLLYRKDKAAFMHFREPLLLAFHWMERQREKTRNGRFAGTGLFPPMQSCDWPEVGQSWCMTDGTNLLGYRYLAEVFELFEDSESEKIRKAYDDYMKSMKEVLRREEEKNTSTEEIFLPNKIGEIPSDPPKGAYFADGPGMLLRAGVIESGSHTAKLVENWFRNRQLMKNGFTGRMNTGRLAYHDTDPWAGHTWYTSFSDLYWFYEWLHTGERQKAEQTLKAQMKWGMSEEYYLPERYADNDPYYTPWMPNASANGRLLMMMADFYKEGC